MTLYGFYRGELPRACDGWDGQLTCWFVGATASQWLPTRAWPSSTVSASHLRAMKGWLSAMGKLTMATLPTASTTARSGLLVAPHSRWTSGTVGDPLTRSHVVGSLRSQEPLLGLHRRKRSCSVWPSGVRVAMVPVLDHATDLGWVGQRRLSSRWRIERGFFSLAASSTPKLVEPLMQVSALAPYGQRQRNIVSKEVVDGVELDVHRVVEHERHLVGGHERGACSVDSVIRAAPEGTEASTRNAEHGMPLNRMRPDNPEC